MPMLYFMEKPWGRITGGHDPDDLQVGEVIQVEDKQLHFPLGRRGKRICFSSHWRIAASLQVRWWRHMCLDQSFSWFQLVSSFPRSSCGKDNTVLVSWTNAVLSLPHEDRGKDETNWSTWTMPPFWRTWRHDMRRLGSQLILFGLFWKPVGWWTEADYIYTYTASVSWLEMELLEDARRLKMQEDSEVWTSGFWHCCHRLIICHFRSAVWPHTHTKHWGGQS